MKSISTGGRRLALFLLAALALLAPGQARAQIFADGFESGDTSAWSVTVGLAPQVFRFSDLDLRDPHVFVDAGILGCFDFTDEPIPLAGFSFNGSLQDQITGDADLDGFLDLSSLLLFRQLDLSAVGERVDFDDGLCVTPPVAFAPLWGDIVAFASLWGDTVAFAPLWGDTDTGCAPNPATEPLITSYDGLGAGTCLETVAGTTSGYAPAVDEPAAPCFVTVAETVPFQLGDLTVTLEDVQLAATFAGDPLALDAGLVRGFLSEAAADALLLPPDLPIVSGQPLSILLPGGTGNCAAGDDRDVHQAVSGWWFYFNYTAERVFYIGG